jgi:tRNA(adenine34) deaminase
MADDHEAWMDRALAMARALADTPDVPVASVIVRDGAVIGEGANASTTRRDPLLHAETVAIQDACRKLDSADLGGATLYTTMEPCAMCAYAIVLAGIRRVVLGGRHADLQRTDMGIYRFEALMGLVAQDVELVTGVRNAECIALRRAWTERTGRFM